jgi:hypothetical protein
MKPFPRYYGSHKKVCGTLPLIFANLGIKDWGQEQDQL